MPVEDKYNVLLMRDDSHVRRFRLSPFWLKMGLYTIMLLILVTGISVYAAVTYWQENTVLIRDLNEIEKQLLEAQVHLERLQNVEKILSANDPEELQAMFGMARTEEREIEELPAATVPESVDIQDEPPVEPVETSVEAAEVEMPEEVATSEPPVNSLDLSELLGSTNLGKATIDNLRLSTESLDPYTLRLAFNLNNTDTGSSLNGRVNVYVISNNGRLVPVEIETSDLTFQIQRFKRLTATFSFPEALNVSDVFGLKLIIKTPEGETLLSKVYNLSSLLE